MLPRHLISAKEGLSIHQLPRMCTRALEEGWILFLFADLLLYGFKDQRGAHGGVSGGGPGLLRRRP